ncbi:hypothetical protein V6N13_016903 [Hibiscus sabdariffa]|uniref:Uncharacterized protein n=1 Tax=Hibiscus sabdariffa TaxID=183260 RepID=A0ABR2PUI8_9ROSI
MSWAEIVAKHGPSPEQVIEGSLIPNIIEFSEHVNVAGDLDSGSIQAEVWTPESVPIRTDGAHTWAETIDLVNNQVVEDQSGEEKSPIQREDEGFIDTEEECGRLGNFMLENVRRNTGL